MANDTCDYLIDQLSGWSVVIAKRMFGGHGLYQGGLMFAIVSDEDVYFKVDAQNRDDYAAAGMPPFTYEAKGRTVQLSYWRVPEEAIEDAEMLCQWAEKSHAAAQRAKKAVKPGLRKKKARHTDA